MVKTLTRHGNSHALVIDKPVMELLGIGPDTPLNVQTDGRTLIVSPVGDAEHKERVRSALERTNDRFGETLRNLAK